MQDHTNLVAQVRSDLRQERGDFPLLRDIIAGYESRDVHLHAQRMVSLSYQSTLRAIDVSEWHQEPTESVRYSNDEDGSFAWVAINAHALYEQYPDQWILVDKAKVVGSASNPKELIQLAQSRGILEPFITKAGPPELPANAVY